MIYEFLPLGIFSPNRSKFGSGAIKIGMEVNEKLKLLNTNIKVNSRKFIGYFFFLSSSSEFKVKYQKI